MTKKVDGRAEEKAERPRPPWNCRRFQLQLLSFLPLLPPTVHSLVNTAGLSVHQSSKLNMADSQQRAVTAAFAPPPPLWRHFTQDNLNKLEEIKKEASKGPNGEPVREKIWSPSELRALDVPDELRFLIPPEIPTGEYSVFGELQTVGWAIKGHMPLLWWKL